MSGRPSHKRPVGIALLCVLSGARAAPDVPHDLQVDNPRTYGHFVGDQLIRRFQFTAPLTTSLTQHELPAPARVNPWLTLSDVRVNSAAVTAGRRYQVQLTYQIINSPTRMLIAAMPAVHLPLAVGTAGDVIEIGEWPIAIGPLAPPDSRGVLAAMRPARAPAPVNPLAHAIAFAVCLTLALGLLGWQQLGRGGVLQRGRRSRSFADAHAEIRRLATQPFELERYRTALRALHRAFDETAKTRLFADRLDRFLADHPHFIESRALAQQFFSASTAEFFGAGAPGALRRFDWLLELSARCRALERRGRA